MTIAQYLALPDASEQDGLALLRQFSPLAALHIERQLSRPRRRALLRAALSRYVNAQLQPTTPSSKPSKKEKAPAPALTHGGRPTIDAFPEYSALLAEASRLWIECSRLHRQLFDLGELNTPAVVNARRALIDELQEKSERHERLWEEIHSLPEADKPPLMTQRDGRPAATKNNIAVAQIDRSARYIRRVDALRWMEQRERGADGRISRRLYRVQFYLRSGEVVSLAHAHTCGLRANLKRNRLRGIQPTDAEGNRQGHIYPVSIDLLRSIEGIRIEL